MDCKIGISRPARLFGTLLDVCQSAAAAITVEVFTTGCLRHARIAEIEVRTAGFVLEIINRAGNAGSASVLVVRAESIYR
jgi:hypothetical protein